MEHVNVAVALLLGLVPVSVVCAVEDGLAVLEVSGLWSVTTMLPGEPFVLLKLISMLVSV